MRHRGRGGGVDRRGSRSRRSRMESACRRRLPRPAGRLVDDMAQRRARSRHVLRVVPHGGAVRDGAAGAAPIARRERAVGRRSEACRQRRQARADVERGGAVLPRPDARAAEDERVARHRVRAERGRAGEPRRGVRLAQRRCAARVRQHVGAAAEDGRSERRVGVAQFPLRAPGRRSARRTSARRSRRLPSAWRPAATRRPPIFRIA